MSRKAFSEDVAAKQSILAAIDEHIHRSTFVGSSSSGIPASAFSERLKCRDRCLFADPINPPDLVPLVELIPAPVGPRVERSNLFARSWKKAGQAPVETTRETKGF